MKYQCKCHNSAERFSTSKSDFFFFFFINTVFTCCQVTLWVCCWILGEERVQHDGQGGQEKVHQLFGCCRKWQRSGRFDPFFFLKKKKIKTKTSRAV